MQLSMAAVRRVKGGDWRQKGIDAFRASKYGEAVECFSRGLEKDRRNKALLSNRSAAHAAQKAFDRALKDANSCVSLDSGWAKGYLRKGQALVGLFQYVAARTAFARGVELSPEDPSLQAALRSTTELIAGLKLEIADSKQVTSASTTKPLRNPEEDVFDNLVKWLKKNGAKFPMLYMQYYSDDYRGVHSLTKIANDTMILYVPKALIMTSEVAKESKICKKIIASGVELRSKHSYLAAYLCQERHQPNSFWKPYLDILPAKYRNMPIFFDEEELRWLRGSFSLDKIEERKDTLLKEYESICAAVPEFSSYTHAEFVWARLVVITRIFGLLIGDLKTDGLVPYADMLNHRRPRETKWCYDNEQKGFTITSLGTLQRGAEVFDSYGGKCNSRFFVNYGFALENNTTDNEVVMRVELPAAATDYSFKVKILRRLGLALTRAYQVGANYRHKKTTEMFGFLRFAHATPSEMNHMATLRGVPVEDLGPVSLRNERAVLCHVKRAAQAVLTGFDTDLKWDTEYLAKPRSEIDPNPNIRNCVVMRHGEKTVLHWFIDLADRGVELLDLPWEEFSARAAKCYEAKDMFEVYVVDVLIPLMTGGPKPSLS